MVNSILEMDNIFTYNRYIGNMADIKYTDLSGLEHFSDTIKSILDNKANVNSLGSYYTKTQVDNLLGGKSDTGHNHSYLPLAGGTMTGNITFDNNRMIRWHQSDSYAISCPTTSSAAYILINGFKGTTINNRLSVYKSSTAKPNTSYHIYTDGSLYSASAVIGGNTKVTNGSDLTLQASSSNSTDPGDLVFANSSGTELGRIWLNGSNFSLRYGSSDGPKTILTDANIGSYALTSLPNHNHNYLSLSGGTLTGNLNIKHSTSPNNSLINFYNSGSSAASTGILAFMSTSNSANNTHGLMFNGSGVTTNYGGANSLMLFNNRGANYYVGTSHNFNNTCYVNGTALSLDGHTHNYLPLSGGTLTGPITIFKTMASEHWGAMTIKYNGGWSGYQNYMAGINVEDSAGIVGRFGVTFDGSYGKFIVRGLYNSGYDISGEVFSVNAIGDVTASKFIGALQGNADSATKLTSNAGSATNPIYFSGGKPVACTYRLNKTVPSNAVFTDTTYNFSGVSHTSGNSDTGEHNCNNITSNGHWYYNSNGPTTTLGASTTDGALYSQAYSTAWVAQIAQDYRNGNLFTRGKNNGTWTDWKAVSYAGHTHSYLPLSGGTMTGSIKLNNSVNITNASGEVLIGPSTGNSTYVGNANIKTVLFATSGLKADISGTRYDILHSNNSSVSKSGETLTVKINGTSCTLTNTNTWRGITDSVSTTDSNTSASATAVKTAYDKANHSHPYLPTSGGTMTGTITMNIGTGIQMKYDRATDGNPWMYANGADAYGIRYFEGDPDKMVLSASGNAKTPASADLCINGNGDGTVTIRGNNICHAGNISSYAITSLPSYTVRNSTTVGKFYLQKDGTDISNCTIKLPTIPSDTNQLTNGAGFITNSTSYLQLNRAGGAQGGISFYGSSYNTWQIYMSNIVAGSGVKGNITPKAGSYVTTWAMRSVIENSSGYGWVWESMANGGTSPSIMMELSSNTGNWKIVGNAYAAGFFQTSDERLKDFQDDIQVDFEKLSKLRKKYFNWKSDENKKLEIGVSAQEIQEIYPELVSTSTDGTLSVAYDKLSVIALKAIDELDERLKRIEKLLNI